MLHFLNLLLFTLTVSFNYLLFNKYPLLTAETASFTLLLLAGFGAILLVSVAVRKLWIFYWAILFLFCDLAFGYVNRPFWEYAFLPSDFKVNLFLSCFSSYYLLVFFSDRLSAPLGHFAWVNYPLALVLWGWIAYGLCRQLPKVFSAFFLVLFLATFTQYLIHPSPLIHARTQENISRQQKTGKGNILILFLDGHIGIEGIPLVSDKAKRLKKQLIDFYSDQGFQLLGRTFSNYFDTHNSMPSILSHTFYRKNDYSRKTLKRNKILESLYEKGYSLRIYQSSEYDFCNALEGKVEKCLVYQSNSVGYLAETPLPQKEKVRFMIASWIQAHQSEILKRLYYAVFVKRLKWRRWRRTGPLPVFKVLEEIQRDLNVSATDTVFFAHLLMPHSPYLYNETCHLNPLDHWEENAKGEDYTNTPESYHRKYSLYFDQVTCTHHMIKTLFEEIKKSKAWKDSTIILLGDHGSRIVTKLPFEDNAPYLTSRDYIDGFSAFAAVKTGSFPSGFVTPTGGYLQQRIPLAVLMGKFFGLKPQNGTEEDFNRIYLRKSLDSDPFVAHEMPDF